MMSVIFEKSHSGKNNSRAADFGYQIENDIPGSLLRKDLDLPDVNETEVVRHYTNLSRLNFGVDNGMYPLGSCTMKYNPKINERISSIKAFAEHHPLADEMMSQGSLKIVHDLCLMLSEITGMNKFSLSPAAGAHGELSGVMIIKKYFEEKKEDRRTILIPDSAHGTNPATVGMCGFEVKSVPSTPEGDVDIEKLKEMLDKDVAAMMLTSPNTLGLFDRNIAKIAEMLHQNGSLFYGDGANLNAVIGTAKMQDMGFDIIHLNLHKTFSTPHGGGGPGSGPIGVVSHLVKFLPVPSVEMKDGRYYIDYNAPLSIGRIHSFYGNFLVALKAYVYILILGGDGLPEVSKTAVLNANYLLSKLKSVYNLPINRHCMHEFVINDKGMPNGITTNDISKRILDFGFHAPTVYFPLIIEGAMMIEPTETESMESLDSFIEIMKQIKKEASENPELLRSAPNSTPVRRVDAVTAARKPVLKWTDQK